MFSRIPPFLVLCIAFGSAGCASKSREAAPRPAPDPRGAPVETAPPNVPEFKPAFAGQTRAPAMRTRTEVDVTEVPTGLENPWALAFLPDGRIFVTEKPTGR